EVNAIASVASPDLLSESTLYVNLEPCSHFGKTPPCASLIIRKLIPRVVVGMQDPNPEVSGRGFEMLRKAGVEVTVSVMEHECRFLNRRFIKFHQKKQPYIILKWAQTTDGFIDRNRGLKQVGPNWITTGALRALVHKWRTEEQAIMIGRRTAEIDNPKLTARLWKGKNPVRIVLDREKKLDASLNVFSDEAKTIVFNAHSSSVSENIEFVKVGFSDNLIPEIMTNLYERGISSVIIEGGAMLLQSFINGGHWDEARVFTGNIRFLQGIKAPETGVLPTEETWYGKDRLEVFHNSNHG
ncbi:MAG: bifunctional diaminohydroxyphosphoribosylaminopyrimidine deaminase/5-amino-6-(5-phosphoribosylamino)uracil reductase RibD, partial [Bacteroidetes bacterium]|nr:bifunctional diaminohydroxyphosphoribosylaminopyrimidine deaminase/5-amino-6-(5-phosphoribosylamino)uracil reductase RibD [Bacteroidota bacterium]